MKKYFQIAVCLILISCNSKSDEELIYECFENYKNAVHDGATESASYYVDQNTLTYYDAMLEHIRKSDSLELTELPVNEQLLIITIRHNLTKEKINELNGKALFKLLITPEYTDTESILSQEIGTIIVEGNEAEGKIISLGSESPWGYKFYRTADEWKIDVTSINFLAEDVVNDFLKENNLTASQYIIESIEKKTGSLPARGVWNPK